MGYYYARPLAERYECSRVSAAPPKRGTRYETLPTKESNRRICMACDVIVAAESSSPGVGGLSNA